MTAKFIDPRAERENSVSLNGILVKLVVGDKEDCIFVHPTILMKTSEFFEAVVKKEWLEESYRVIKLAEHEIETVTAYVQWPYTDFIFSKSKEPIADLPLAQYEQYIFLAKLYVLGEKLVDSELQNRFIDCIITATHKKISGVPCFPDVNAVNIIYGKALKSSPAR